MAAYNPNLMAQYATQFFLDELIQKFADLNLTLKPALEFKWDGQRSFAFAAGDVTPVIRKLPESGTLGLEWMPWGIPYRRQSQSPPLFNFDAGIDDFALSARVLVPLTAPKELGKSGKTPSGLVMAAGIERAGAWTMLTHRKSQGALELALLVQPRDWKTWLVRGQLPGR